MTPLVTKPPASSTLVEKCKIAGCLKGPLCFETSPLAVAEKTVACVMDVQVLLLQTVFSKLTWLVLGGDPAARSHRVEQFTAL